MVLTYRYRVKNAKGLLALAGLVNLVWNYCGGVQKQASKALRRWPSAFDLIQLTRASRELGLHSDSIAGVCFAFARARDAAKHRPRWRKSLGARRSLGWIPFNAPRAIRMDGNAVIFQKHRYRLWLHRPIGGRILCGSFSEDARGRWYLNLQCEVETRADCGVESVGIDLGLHSLATTSDGEKIENPKWFARHAAKLASAQRAGRKGRVRAIYAKIRNARRHRLHQVSLSLVKRYQKIIVGNVSSSQLAKTRKAKSVLDAGWSTLRGFLRYKAIAHGGEYIEVSERFSTQLCSECGSLGGPRGLEGLGVREWDCTCGAHHDRDVNAARNILSSGQNVALRLTGSPGL